MTEKVIVKVGMAELKAASGEGQLLRTVGLGSCVGIALYDRFAKVAGLAHIMLPSSDIARDNPLNKAKYADTAIPELLARMQEIGAVMPRIVAKLAGGAQMFSSVPESSTLRIGQRNVDACKAGLLRYNIPISAEDTGGNYGRTIELDSSTGILFIRSVQFGAKEL